MSTDSRGTTHGDGNDSPQVRDLKSKLRQERQKVGRLRLELDSAKDALQQAGLLDPPGELPSSEDEDVEYEDSSGEEDGDVSVLAWFSVPAGVSNAVELAPPPSFDCSSKSR